MRKVLALAFVLLSPLEGAPLAAGPSASDWRVVWAGRGRVAFDETGVLMRSGVPSGPHETHSVLVLSKATLARPLRDFHASMTVATEAQLRPGKPNEWEVFWFFFNYVKPPRALKKTNFVLIQTRTGLQLGRAFDEKGEVYLARPKSPSIAAGRTYRLEVVKTGQHVEVSVDGRKVLVFDGGGAKGSLYDVPGAIGLYCEDSQVRVRDVVISPR